MCFAQFPIVGVKYIFFCFQNGLISAVPYICNFVSSVSFGNISDVARRRALCSTEVARKIANTAGVVIIILLQK